jgi:uncharacterized membrane-anchored protein
MKARVAIFALVCVAQLVWASAALWSGEARLREGEPWLFRTAPVDPADLLRGRYVALAFEQTSGPAEGGARFEPGDTAYARLGRDTEGFARIASVAPQRPPAGEYLEVRVNGQSGGRVSFDFPIDRFYLPELEAPVAERLYRQRAADAWAEVRVHEGRATLVDVWLDGVPLAEAARESLAE